VASAAYRRGMGKTVLTCVLALVFGFGGAVVGVMAFQDSLRGEQGATGLTGAPGPEGPAGQDGADGQDGQDGAAGARGPAGRAAKTEPRPVDLGMDGCSGRSVQVITDVTITQGKAPKLRLTKKNVCVVQPVG